jgi:hypothetical protein
MFNMKTTTFRFTRGLLLLVATSMLSWAATGGALADDHHDAWSHDKGGYWDDHNRHHAFVSHENHHGYWRTHDDGSRVFINID